METEEIIETGAEAVEKELVCVNNGAVNKLAIGAGIGVLIAGGFALYWYAARPLVARLKAKKAKAESDKTPEDEGEDISEE